ncbi:MAG: rRNA adenine dimethyltransferase family protein [bacterium]
MISSRKNTKSRVRFSQHFLNDANVLIRISENLTDISGKTVVEVGPGRGALTRVISEKQPKSLILIEKDPSMAENLKKMFEKIEIVNIDALDYELKSEIFVSSVPYSVTREILLLLCRSNSIKTAFLIIQKEVAEKITNEKPLPISVYVRRFFSAEKIFDIKKNSFTPPPNVISSFVKLKRKRMYESMCGEYWNFLTLTFSRKNRLAKGFGEEYAGKRIYELSEDDLWRIYADKHIHTH